MSGPEKGIFDNIANLLISNSELAGDLKGPLASMNAAIDKTIVAAQAFNAATAQAVVAAQDWKKAISAFEVVLAKYGVQS